MRMMPTHFLMPQPATVKKAASQIAHISPPLKGLNLSSKLNTGDPLTAGILVNMTVEDDRITVRGGYRKVSTISGNPPIWHMIPYYSTVSRLISATADSLYDAFTAALVKGGFTSGDWHWTAFSNLSQQDFTVMVNGADGVWSWDGELTSADVGPVDVTNLTGGPGANPATCTVDAADISKFHNGQVVLIAGADSTHTAANGYRAISAVSTVTNTFQLVGVDLTSASGAQTTGVTADPPGTGVVKEPVTAPASMPWISVNGFQIVVAHMNRLWFADNANLAVYYLPLQQKSGEVKAIPLNAYFKRGGSIRAMFTWSVDGGAGIDDKLAVFTTNGECAIFQGIDPDSVFTLSGIFRFDAPMSKHSILNYGGELYVLISTGLVPMSTLMKAESEQLGQIDKSVLSLFMRSSNLATGKPGWQVILNPQTGRAFCNIPQPSGARYNQMVRHMPRPVWSEFRDIPSRSWAWMFPYMWFGDDKGNTYQGHTNYLSDDGAAIKVDVQMAWSQFKTPGNKHFKMVQVYYESDGELKPRIDVNVKYQDTPPENEPDVTFTQPGALWDVATWDVDYWATGPIPTSSWNGVGRMGHVGAVRLTAAIRNCEFSITGFDLIYEIGAAVG